MKDKKNKQKKYLIMGGFVAVVILLTASYALFTYAKSSDQKNTLKTGTLILNLEEEEGLTLIDSAPISDSEALKGDSYNFSIHNTGTETSKYQIYLLDDEEKYQSDNCTDKKFPWSKIKYSITKNNGNSEVGHLGAKNGIITTTTLKSGTTDRYQLRLWIDQNASNEVAGLHFHAKMQVKAILEDKTDFNTGA